MNNNIASGLVTIVGSGIALLGIIVYAFFFSFITSWLVFMLWNNCLVGSVAGVSQVTWLNAWGLTILCNLLFKTSAKKESK